MTPLNFSSVNDRQLSVNNIRKIASYNVHSYELLVLSAQIS